MATWKKIIVSGSAAELSQLNVGTNQQISSSVNDTFLSGSFSGSFFGDGSGLSGVAASFPVTEKTDLATADKFFINDGASKFVTYGNLLTDLAGTNLAVEGTDSLTLATELTGLSASGSFSGSFQGNFVGTTDLPDLTDGNGIADFTYDGSTTATISVEVSGSTLEVGTGGVRVADSGITANQIATSVAGDGLAGGGGTALSVNVDDSTIEINTDTLRVKDSGITNAKLQNSTITLGSSTLTLGGTTTVVDGLTASGSFSGSFQGDGSELTGIASTLNFSGSDGSNGSVSLTTQALTITGTANEIETAASSQTLTIGLPNDVTIGNDLTVTNDLTVSGNTTIEGNLNVNGTTTTISSSNLLVADKFALFASGSTSAVDGGIIVQSDVAGTGLALGYDSSADRWAFQNGLAHDATTITPDAYLVSATSSEAANLPANPNYGGASNGYGNIFVASDTGDIYIYS